MTALSIFSIDQSFINSLFQHQLFQTRLIQTIQTNSQNIDSKYSQLRNKEVDEVIEEISELIKGASSKHEQLQYQQLKQELKNIHEELDKLKDIMSFQPSKIEPNPRQFSQDFNMQDEQLFDLPSIKRTIDFLQEKVKQISVCSSISFDGNETRDKQDAYQEKLTLAMSQLEQSFTRKYSHFQETVNKRLQKQQKTINSILQTLNDLNGSSKTDKTAATLSNSKSATKLKNFFGFHV